MMRLLVVLIPLALLAFDTGAYQIADGDDVCIKGLTKIDMCAKARELSNEIATTLPMPMSQNMIWESVAAIQSTIQLHIRLTYDRVELEDSFRRAGVPLSSAKQTMRKSAYNLCQPSDSPTRAFVNLGGTIRYVYLLKDGERFLTVDVETCN